MACDSEHTTGLDCCQAHTMSFVTTRKMKTPDEAFGANVAAGRSIRRISQRELADKLTAAGFRVDAPAVSRIEKGARSVRLTEALIIADVLNLELSMLVSSIDMSPGAELRRIRRAATEAYHQLREPLQSFLQGYLSVYDHLVENPELVAEVEIEGVGIASPAEYFALTADRIWELEASAQAEHRRDIDLDYAVARDNAASVGIRRVMDAYLDAVVISPEERQQLESAQNAARHRGMSMARPRTPLSSYGRISTIEVDAGKWRARTRYRFDDGKLRQVERFAPSKAKAEEALRKALTTIQVSTATEVKRETRMRDLGERFLRSKADRAPRTRDVPAQRAQGHRAAHRRPCRDGGYRRSTAAHVGCDRGRERSW